MSIPMHRKVARITNTDILHYLAMTALHYLFSVRAIIFSIDIYNNMDTFIHDVKQKKQVPKKTYHLIQFI